MTTMPYWIHLLEALATPTLALLAAAIAFAHWKIARQKVAADLFERRYDAFTATCEAVEAVMAEHYLESGHIVRYLGTVQRAKFLFGREVSVFLDRIGEHFQELHRIEQSTKQPYLVHMREQRVSQLSDEIGLFYFNFNRLAQPYLRMQ